MANHDLHELLAELHTRLQSAASLDADSRQQLGILSADIKSALAHGGTADAAHESRLETLAVKFEADHPALADALRQIVVALGNAGI